MPEVSVGLGLERFTLVAQGEVYCTIDIVEQETASLALTALPDFPLQIQADLARQFVAAWEKHGELAGQSYEVRHEQRAI